MQTYYKLPISKLFSKEKNVLLYTCHDECKCNSQIGSKLMNNYFVNMNFKVLQ